MAIYLGQQLIGSIGGGSGSSAPTQEQINTAVEAYLQDNPVSSDPDYVFTAGGTNHGGQLFVRNAQNTGGSLSDRGAIYNCVEANVTGYDAIRFCGQDGGGSTMYACTFVDSDNAIVSFGETYTKGTVYRDKVVKIPAGAAKVYVNGSGGGAAMGGYLYLGKTNQVRTSKFAVQDVIGAMWGRLSNNREKFAWKSDMPACIAFTFDDTLDSLPDTAAIFKEYEVPMCFGCIPEKIYKKFDTTGLTIASDYTGTAAELMKEMVDDYGGEVLAHGSDAFGIVNNSTIDNQDFLFNKFVSDKIKLESAGFKVRGIVRVGGNGNICNDPRTDIWIKALYDYGDLYGLEEPFNHARASVSSNSDPDAAIAEDKAIIDAAIARGGFTPLLFHQVDNDRITALIEYVLEKQSLGLCQITNYATAYDTYGSTVSREADLAALRSQITGGYSDGDEEEY